MSPRVKLCAEVSAAVSTALAVKIVCIATPRNCARYSRARFATRKPATSSVTLFGLRNCGGSSSPPDWRGRLAALANFKNSTFTFFTLLGSHVIERYVKGNQNGVRAPLP